MRPLDIRGKTISWKMNDQRFYGEVVDVFMRGYREDDRFELRKFMTMLTMDGKFVTIPGDHMKLKELEAQPYSL